MAGKKNAAGPKPPRTRKERMFPAWTFAEALTLAEGIQKYAAGQKVRRLTLFEKLNKEPDSVESRRLVTASGQYGLTKGGYQAEFLELTAEGDEATSDDVPPTKKLAARFQLAIRKHSPFDFLYEKIKGNKVPAKEVMVDYLSDANVEDDEKAECIDTFILNAKFLGLLRTIGGSERLIPIEQVIEEAPQLSNMEPVESSGLSSVLPPTPQVWTVAGRPPKIFRRSVFTSLRLERRILRSAAMRTF